MKTIVTASALIIFLAACSKPQDVVIPTDSKNWDTELAPRVKDLSDGDKQLLSAYLARTKIVEAFGGSPMPVGMTVGQAIEKQKEWIAEQDAKKAAEEELRKQVEAKNAATAAELQKSVVIAFVSEHIDPKDFEHARYSDTFVIDMAVKNIGDKPIKGVKAEAIFKNTFGDIIYRTRLNIEEHLSPGQQITWEGGHELNQFDDTDKKLMNLSPSTFTVDTHPLLVVYEDGTTSGATE